MNSGLERECERPMELMCLPVVMVENILSYLSFDEIARCRLVCRAWDEMCGRLLNVGWASLERLHAGALRRLKAQLPRRESERRYHPLARHCDILTSVETRISMLNMTYGKWIDARLACFIPGRVVDEMARVVRLVSCASAASAGGAGGGGGGGAGAGAVAGGEVGRAHEVLQELRDISSMAIEHFDDKISPALRRRLPQPLLLPEPPPEPPPALGLLLAAGATPSPSAGPARPPTRAARLARRLAHTTARLSSKVSALRHTVRRQRRALAKLTRAHTHTRLLLGEVRRRLEECEARYGELQPLRAPPAPAPAPAPPSPHYLPHHDAHHAGRVCNMRPRCPRIRLPSLSEQHAPAPAQLAPAPAQLAPAQPDDTDAASPPHKRLRCPDH